MIINSISKLNIPVINTSKSNAQPRLNLLSCDVFEKSNISFKAQNDEDFDDKSFSELQKWAEETGFIENISDIMSNQKRRIGAGFEGVTYEIPNTDKWVLKKYKRSNMVPRSVSKAELAPIQDISPKLNIGQTVAILYVPINCNYSSMYWLLKRQSGQEYGVSTHHDELDSKFNRIIHLESLKSLSEMPQSAFDKCIQDVKYITEIGFAIDYKNPNNIMLDKNAQTINFVDVNDRLQNRKEQYAEVLYSLLDGDFGDKFNTEDIISDEDKKQAKEYSDIIVGKYFNAMKNNKAKFDNTGYLIISSIINNYFGVEKRDEEYNEFLKNGLL